MRRNVRFAVLCALMVITSPIAAQDLTIYDDTLQNNFLNYSYPDPSDPEFNFASTVQVHGGTKAIAFTGNNYNAVSFAHPSGTFTTAQYPTLHFWVHGGATGGQQLQVILELNNVVVKNAELDSYISGGAIASGQWREVTVSLSAAPLSYNGSFDRIDIQCDAASQAVLYLDDVALQPAAAGNGALTIEHDVTVGSMSSDRFSWTDSAGKARVAVLAHNDGPQGPTAPDGYPNHGGALREYRYQMPDNSTRVCNVTTYGNGGYGGFGYVVSHRGDGGAGGIGDDSPLGYAFAGTFERVFEGRNHAIFRFRQNYPRYSSTSANPANTLYQVPVVIDWIFAAGRDHPVWAITYDLSGVPESSLNDDSRAPYGELNIDGDGSTNIDGVGWGDRKKFVSQTAPVTLNSHWDWSATNSVPYVKLWITATNAMMGTVLTQTMTQQDAGGGRNPFYHDLTAFWGKNSTQGNAGGSYRMPWQGEWPYQAIAFSIGTATPSNNARLTWGTQYGFLGQHQYDPHDGVQPLTSAWPKKSYSTFIILGTNSSDPVAAQVTQIENVQSVSFVTANGDHVVHSGAAGVDRADNVSYAPAGYNHLYGAFALSADANNQLDASMTVGSGPLKHPLFIITDYTGPMPTVRLDGTLLVSDVGYYASLRSTAIVHELWITLNSDLTAAVHHLEINTNTPNITPSGPTTFCQGGSVTLTASTAPGAGVSYLWSPNGETTQAINVTASGSYSVTVTVNGTPGTSAPTVVTVRSLPATPVINSAPSVPPSASLMSASVTANAGSTYQWGITNGTITSGQGTSAIKFTAGAAGSVDLTAVETDANGCVSATGSATIPIVAPAASGFYVITPCRLADTRKDIGPAAAWPILDGGATRTVTAINKCLIPPTAKAISMNLTVTSTAASGFLTFFPSSFNVPPRVSMINFRTGQTRGNNGVLILGPDGAFKVYNGSGGQLHFIVDVNGYFQ